jgi:hypothetical protein
LILSCAFLTGFVLDVRAATMGPAFVASCLPKLISGQSGQIEGKVLRKRGEANRPITSGYATFVEDPTLERARRRRGAGWPLRRRPPRRMGATLRATKTDAGSRDA